MNDINGREPERDPPRRLLSLGLVGLHERELRLARLEELLWRNSQARAKQRRSRTTNAGDQA